LAGPAPREGTSTWEDLNLDDVDIRLKFAGMFHRGKRTPKRFMMRLKVGGVHGFVHAVFAGTRVDCVRAGPQPGRQTGGIYAWACCGGWLHKHMRPYCCGLSGVVCGVWLIVAWLARRAGVLC
jgi:hypothetical protein